MTTAEAMKWAAETGERLAKGAERLAKLRGEWDYDNAERYRDEDDEDVQLRCETVDAYPEGPIGMTRDKLVPVAKMIESMLEQSELNNEAVTDEDHERVINARFYAREMMRELLSIGDIDCDE